MKTKSISFNIVPMLWAAIIGVLLSLALLAPGGVANAQNTERTLPSSFSLTDASSDELQRIVDELIAQIEYLQQQLALPSAANAPVTTNQTTSTQSCSFVWNRNLKILDSGPDVLALQRFLNNRGFTIAASGPGSPGNETSHYGRATGQAVARFQEANRAEILVPAGATGGSWFFGPSTRAYIKKLCAEEPIIEEPDQPPYEDEDGEKEAAVTALLEAEIAITNLVIAMEDSEVISGFDLDDVEFWLEEARRFIEEGDNMYDEEKWGDAEAFAQSALRYAGRGLALLEESQPIYEIQDGPKVRIIFNDTDTKGSVRHGTQILLDDNNVYESGEWFPIEPASAYCPKDGDTCQDAIPPRDWKDVPGVNKHPGLIVVRKNDAFQVVHVGRNNSGWESSDVTIEFSDVTPQKATSISSAPMDKHNDNYDKVYFECKTAPDSVDRSAAGRNATLEANPECSDYALKLHTKVWGGKDGVLITTLGDDEPN